MYDFKKILSNFRIKGEFESEEKYGFGHINDTFVVNFNNGDYKRYILQRINKNVFINPEQLMSNIQGVTEFLAKKIQENSGDPLRETLSIVKAIDNKSFFIDDNGEYWRVYIFIEDIKTYQIVENPIHLYESGKAFGRFQNLLSDYPVNSLYDTIENFHNTKKRYEKFEKVLKVDSCNRAKIVSQEIEFILSRKKMAPVLVDLIESGDLPIRVTHNDTKFNNVLIDVNTNKAICVVDLDTIMKGLSLYDFGDSIRSGTNTAEEDEVDLSKVSMDMVLFENFSKGFLEETITSLTKKEIELLVFSCKLLTFELGIRFLTDYLEGDIYFKTSHENHNLERTRNQFKLLEDMENKTSEMEDIIKKYSNV